MTDEMTVQGQRPSALPYFIGGAAVGGAAGHYAKDYLYKVPKYASYEDILKESEDTFNKAIEKNKNNAEVKKVWEAAKEHAANIKAAEDAAAPEIEKIMAEHSAYDAKIANEEVVTKFEEAVTKAKTAENEFIPKLENAIKEGKIDGITKEDAGKLSAEDLTKKAKEIYKDEAKYKDVLKEEYKVVTDAKAAVETAKTNLEAKARELGCSAKKELSEEGTKLVETAKKPISEAKAAAKKVLENDLGKIKIGHKWINAAVGALVLGLGALALRPSAKD